MDQSNLSADIFGSSSKDIKYIKNSPGAAARDHKQELDGSGSSGDGGGADAVVLVLSESEHSPTDADSDDEPPPQRDPESLTHADYLALITDDARLANGQVDAEKIVQLRIGDWSIFRYKCWLCSALCADERLMLQHLADRHPDDEHKWQCSLCPKRVEPSEQAGYFLRHHVVRIHYPYLNFCCPICNVFFWDMAKKKAHLVSYKHRRLAARPPRICKCERCGRVLTTAVSLKRHIARMHDNIPYTKQFECYLCRRPFQSKHAVHRHMSVKHCVGKLSTRDIPREFMCDVCGKKFHKKGQLERHTETHLDGTPHECDICHKSFKLRSSLTVHKYLHREKNFLCDQCDYRTYAMHMLKAHKAIHGEKQHACEFCGKRFAQAGALQIHRRIHTGEKPFACPFCEYRTVCGANLNAHTMQVHKVRYFKKRVKKEEAAADC